ncbi:MAG: site-2 protease family protein [Candidatus Omnitrophica bacterium]|nr:site-2 protease family protein [Candidatus Omnitrophota bacterium]
MTFLIFVVILSVLILVHEFGHFWTARKLGVRVEEFALGFGPKLFSWTRNGTEYRLCAIPLGGYVKMAGDERIRVQGKPDEFFSKPVGHRALIALMGPVVNFIFAYLCFCIVFMVGLVDLDASSKNVPAKVGKVMAASPAERAGLHVNDLVLQIDGKPVSNWGEMQDDVMASKGKARTLLVSREKKNIEIHVTPEFQQTKDIFGKEHEVSRIGIQPGNPDSSEHLVIRKYGFLPSFIEAGKELWSVTARTYEALWEIVTGQKSAKEGMTGLIGIFFVIKFATAVGFAFLLHVVGVVSASLAIFNVLPLIPLDGGHLALLGLEKLRGRPLSDRTDDILGKVGFALIIMLALFVFYLDFERIGLIDKVRHFFVK